MYEQFQFFAQLFRAKGSWGSEISTWLVDSVPEIMLDIIGLLCEACSNILAFHEGRLVDGYLFLQATSLTRPRQANYRQPSKN